MREDTIQLSQLIDMDKPNLVFDEVKTIVSMMYPRFHFSPLTNVFEDVLLLFSGKYPGYRECVTGYHDLKHTTDALLAAVRLMHGAVLAGENLGAKNVALGIISALLHDSGYIQDIDDQSGTGGKYTLTHIERSIAFMDQYFRTHNFSRADFSRCSDILHCTGLQTKLTEIRFQSNEIELLGKILGAADLLGQMADRTYLEKLPFLYKEYKEGGIDLYADEIELLEKTIDFYAITGKRLNNELGGVHHHLVHHFKARWNIDSDLYAVAMERNIRYLKYVLSEHRKEYRKYFRRGGYIKRLEEGGR